MDIRNTQMHCTRIWLKENTKILLSKVKEETKSREGQENCYRNIQLWRQINRCASRIKFCCKGSMASSRITLYFIRIRITCIIAWMLIAHFPNRRPSSWCSGHPNPSLLGVSRNTITAIIHLTNQDLHIDITCFGFLERILEPALDTIRNDLRKRHALVLMGGVVTIAGVAGGVSASTALHLLPIKRLILRQSWRIQRNGFRGFQEFGCCCSELVDLSGARKRFSHIKKRESRNVAVLYLGKPRFDVIQESFAKFEFAVRSDTCASMKRLKKQRRI